MDVDININKLFEKSDLIPAVVQEAGTGEVLMLAYMNAESLRRTIDTGLTWFYSRSRGELWNKGETSGHRQTVVRISADCDDDTLLVEVTQTGAACHTGNKTCFYRRGEIYENPDAARPGANAGGLARELYALARARRETPAEGSYTCYLFEQGIDKILKKCAEECGEMIIAAKNADAARRGARNGEQAAPDTEEAARADTENEVCDLYYHVIVLLAELGIPVENIEAKLRERGAKIGNLKQMKKTDRVT